MAAAGAAAGPRRRKLLLAGGGLRRRRQPARALHAHRRPVQPPDRPVAAALHHRAGRRRRAGAGGRCPDVPAPAGGGGPAGAGGLDRRHRGAGHQVPRLRPAAQPDPPGPLRRRRAHLLAAGHGQRAEPAGRAADPARGPERSGRRRRPGPGRRPVHVSDRPRGPARPGAARALAARPLAFSRRRGHVRPGGHGGRGRGPAAAGADRPGAGAGVRPRPGSRPHVRGVGDGPRRDAVAVRRRRDDVVTTPPGRNWPPPSRQD